MIESYFSSIINRSEPFGSSSVNKVLISTHYKKSGDRNTGIKKRLILDEPPIFLIEKINFIEV